MTDLATANDKFIVEWQKLIALIANLPLGHRMAIADQTAKVCMAISDRDNIFISHLKTNTEDAMLHLKLVAFDLESTKREKAELQEHLNKGDDSI